MRYVIVRLRRTTFSTPRGDFSAPRCFVRTEPGHSDLVTPVRAAIVNDYSVVLAGVSALIAPFRDRVEVVELDANLSVAEDVDVVLYDTFARPEPGLGALRDLVANPRARRVVVFSWTTDAAMVDLALSLGAAGFVSKASSADDLVDAIERAAAGETVVGPGIGVPGSGGHRHASEAQLAWPGMDHGLTAREAEVMALIVQGKSNAEISDLLYLSINTIKGNIRSAYRKIGATNRVQAVLWGTANGMQPDESRFTAWLPAPRPG